jgi:HEAT repeat protein
MKDPSAVGALVIALESPNLGYQEKTAAARSLGDIGRSAVEPLVSALNEKDATIRWNAASALAEIKDPRAAAALLSALRTRDTEVIAGGMYILSGGARQVLKRC